MDDNIDISRELKEKNQEMLLEKKKTDLDKSTDSLIEFYRFYSTETVATEIGNRICTFHNIDIHSEQAEIFNKTIVVFLTTACETFENEIKTKRDILKQKIKELSDEEYNKALQLFSVSITNSLSEYYIANLEMLNVELNQNVDDETKEKIKKYLYDIIAVKMINNLKEKFIYSMKVISNNNVENKEVIDIINEKTGVNRV
jgi:hypothetical protein